MAYPLGRPAWPQPSDAESFYEFGCQSLGWLLLCGEGRRPLAEQPPHFLPCFLLYSSSPDLASECILGFVVSCFQRNLL